MPTEDEMQKLFEEVAILKDRVAILDAQVEMMTGSDNRLRNQLLTIFAERKRLEHEEQNKNWVKLIRKVNT